MPRLYLMQRFDMNEGFPNSSPQGIAPYIASYLVLFNEAGDMVPMTRSWGHVDGLSPRIAQGLKKLQDQGYEISGDVHPSFDEPINIAGDVECYRPFTCDSTIEEMLSAQGVELV